jgi:2-polyprenyl-6-methoxyphenol hydroxylase-like FAD-dependent oxidoreductase
LPSKEILISGAGPSGLALGIFLAEQGFRPRIIDKKSEVSKYSKALGVNPRSLEILERYGIAQRFLSNGHKMPAVNLWKGDKHVLRNDFSKAKHKYPFVLVQPQRESELILLEELAKRKIEVEYSTQLISFSESDARLNDPFGQGKVNAVINKNGETSSHACDILIAADGAHSDIRKQSGIEFRGFRYKETWELYDVELETSIPADEASIRIFNEGGMIMIRIKENTWRVAGNLQNVLHYLPKNTRTGTISWQTKFNIAHNIAATLVKGNVVLIGDAAHIHSPIGGRGMNLGIEDAFVLSKFISGDRLQEYNKVRRPYLHRTVSRVNNMTQFMAGHSAFRKFMRNRIGLFKPFFPFAMMMGRNFALGLDRNFHE